MAGFEISYYFCNEKVINPMVTPMLIYSIFCSRKFSCLEGEAEYER